MKKFKDCDNLEKTLLILFPLSWVIMKLGDMLIKYSEGGNNNDTI